MARKTKKEEVIEVVRTKKDIIRDDIDALVKQYNSSVDYAEFKRMKKLSDKISEKVQDYAVEVKGECYDELKKADNPLFAAAMEIFFDTLSVKEKKQEEGGKKLVVEETGKRVFIDPLDLHEKVDDGIGVDKAWNTKVAGLNFSIAILLGFKLGLTPEELAVVSKNYKASDEAKKLYRFIDIEHPETFDGAAVTNFVKDAMQDAVNAMIGNEYEVTDDMVTFLLAGYAKVDTRMKVGLVFSKHANFRMRMLQVCYMAITGEKPCVDHPSSSR